MTVQLTIPPDAKMLLSLKDPSGQTEGSSTLSGNTRSVDLIARATGLGTIHVARDQGPGTYQLAVILSG